jgi:hypothetical protein
MSHIKSAKHIRSRPLRWFLEEYLFKMDHCREDNTLVHYYCDEIPRYIDIECLHYEGTSTEELLRLLAGLVLLEKVLRAEVSVRLIDRVREKLLIRVYEPARLCRERRKRSAERER